MNKYKVEITKTYCIDVLANNTAEAIEKAEPVLDQKMLLGTEHHYQTMDTDFVVYDVSDTDDPFYPSED